MIGKNEGPDNPIVRDETSFSAQLFLRLPPRLPPKSLTWPISHCACMARYSWAATSSDTADGSERSAKNSLRHATHSGSFKGSTGALPFQAFFQLSTVLLYSFIILPDLGYRQKDRSPSSRTSAPIKSHPLN